MKTKHLVIWTGFVMFFILFSCNTWADTYYVAQKHPETSDKNPGTEELPWKTINGALPHIKSGDTLCVKEGTYREQIIIPNKPWHFFGKTYPAFPSGKSYSEMISFIAYPGDEVIIKGSDVVTGWKKYKDNIWVKGNWPHNSQQVFCDEKLLQQIGGKIKKYLMEKDRWQGRKGDSLEDMEPGSFYYDIEGKKLYVWLKKGDDPNKHLMEVSVRGYFFIIRYLDYIKVSGFKMRHANTSTMVWNPFTVNGSYNIFENMEITWTDYSGFGMSGTNNTIVNSRFNHCGLFALGAAGWGFRVINCETSYNNYRKFKEGWGSGGCKFIPSNHDFVISGHIASYNNGPGIWFDGRMSNVTIQNCICHHNTGPGIFYEIGERGVIKNNVCYENKGRGIYIANSSNTLVAHNICYRNGMSGIVFTGTGRKGGLFGREKDEVLYVRNNIVWGNIFMDNCHPDLCPKGPDGTGKSWSKRAELIMPDPRPTNYNNISDYNIFYRSDKRDIPFWMGWGEVTYNFGDWQQATGNDKHSIIAKPTFEDLQERDFQPTEDSPAIEFVRPHMSVRYDFAGRDRPCKKKYYTAGAYEPKK